MARRVAVVTGASSGIGRRVAVDLGRYGWRVCAIARRAALLDELVEEIGGRTAGHSYVATDITDPDAVRAMREHVDGSYGRCDALVNNAGYSERVPIDATDAVAAVERQLATNYVGAVRCTAELLPLLEAAAPSVVVNVASVAGRFPVAGHAGYAASKFALVGWSESVRGELARHGIHVGLVEPGPLPTEGFPQQALAEHPIGRHGLADVEDVSRAVLEVIAHRRRRRTVPRAYYLPQLLERLAPGPVQWIAERVIQERNRREDTGDDGRVG